MEIKTDKTIGTERRVACLNCDTETYHKVAKSIDLDDSGEWGIFWSQYEIIVCQGCRTYSFRKAWGSDDVIGEDEEGDLIYDEEEELFPSRIKGRKEIEYVYHLPSRISKIYRETHKAISSKQSILAGMGIRALVEAICVEKKTKGRDLKEKIEDLVSIGFLTKDGAEILHQTRLYGNDAAHEILEIKDSDLNILMDIAENLLKNTYILPKKVMELEKNKKDLLFN